MSAEENRRRVYQWFEEVWSNGRAEVIDELMDSQCVTHGLGESFQGVEPFKQFFTLYRGAFPDMRIQVDHVVVEGEWTAQRFSGGGTHTGPGLGPAPTGKPVGFTGMSFTRWRNGRMVEAYNNVDLTDVHRTVGVL